MIGASLPSRDKAYKKFFWLSNRFLLDLQKAPSLSDNSKSRDRCSAPLGGCARAIRGFVRCRPPLNGAMFRYPGVYLVMMQT
jgi:hypothetical protein